MDSGCALLTGLPSIVTPRSQPSLGMAPDASLLDEDADPTYTHFAHRDAFLALLGNVRGWRVDAPSGAGDEEGEERVVAQMGGIVGGYRGENSMDANAVDLAGTARLLPLPSAVARPVVARDRAPARGHARAALLCGLQGGPGN